MVWWYLLLFILWGKKIFNQIKIFLSKFPYVKYQLIRLRNLIKGESKQKVGIEIFKEKKNLFDALKITNNIGFSRFTFEKINYALPENKKIVVLAPHPDDEIIGAGGTLIQASKKKCKVEIIYLTSGKKNEKKIRENELRKVCKDQNFTFYIIGGEANKKLLGLRKISKILYNSKPDIIFLPFVLDDNIDHKNANDMLYQIYNVQHSNFLENKLKIWSYQIYNPLLTNRVIDITSSVRQKEKLIRFYKSQFKSRDWAHYTLGMNAWNSRFLNNKKGKAWAECFCVQSLPEYLNLYKKVFRDS